MSLQNKTILVTGGSRGIGRSIVLDLAERGANVAFTYHNRSGQCKEGREARPAAGWQRNRLRAGCAAAR